MSHKLVMKTLATVLCVAFTAQTAFADLSQRSLWEDRRANRAESQKTQVASLPFALPAIRATAEPIDRPLSPRLAGLSSKLSQPLSFLPTDRVTLGETRDAGTRAPVIILQDIHLNPEAQANIEATVAALIDGDAVASVHLEGAFGTLDLKRFRSFSLATRKKLSSAMVEAGMLGGPSAAAITTEKAPLVIGADDAVAYERNVQAVKDAALIRPAVTKDLQTLRRDVDAKKISIYGEAMKRFDALTKGHRAGTLSYGDYLAALIDKMGLEPNADARTFLSAYRLEKSLNFTRVEAERRAVIEKLVRVLSPRELAALTKDGVAFRAGQIGFADFYRRIDSLCSEHGITLTTTPAFRDYLRYVLLADQIDAARLLAWTDAAEDRLVARLAATPEEKSVAASDRDVALAEKLVRFEFTPAEWTRWSAGHASLTPGLSAQLSAFERFYREADNRTAALLTSVTAGSDGRPRLLVVGGFHTPLLSEKLRKLNIPFAIASPRLTRVDGAANAYLNIFTREKTPLEKLFAGEKLTINPSGQVLGDVSSASQLTGNSLLVRAAVIDLSARQALPPSAGVAAKPLGDGAYEVTLPDGQTFNLATEPLTKDQTPLEPTPVAGTQFFGVSGSWGFWQNLADYLSRYVDQSRANSMRPFVAGAVEGLYAGIIALVTRSSGEGLAIGLGLWFVTSVAMHLFTGVIRWDSRANIWQIKRYVRFANDSDPKVAGEIQIGPVIFAKWDRDFLRANLVATTSILAFPLAYFMPNIIFVLLLAALPHALTNLTIEQRVDEERRRAIGEIERSFVGAQSLAAILSNPAVPDPIQRARLIEGIRQKNILAAFLAFSARTGRRYQMAFIMQPGSNGNKSRPGFKTLNDSIGMTLVNRLYAYRNSVSMRFAEEEFADAVPASRAGFSPVQLIVNDVKITRLAIDTDVMKGKYPDSTTRDAEIDRRLKATARRVDDHMRQILTVKGFDPDFDNSEIVDAVRSAQRKGALASDIEGFPMYWGVSGEAVTNGNADDMVTQDAQVLAAINAARANAGNGNTGGRFNADIIASTLRNLRRTRAELLELGALRAETYTDGIPVIPAVLSDALKKLKPAEVQTMISALFGFDAAKSAVAYEKYMQHRTMLLVFDYTKPWVGTREREEALRVAQRVNESIERIRDLPLRPNANTAAEWNSLREFIGNTMAEDTRAPFLGSQYEYYGRSTRVNGEQVAAFFVDFRRFGGMIDEQLELTTLRLSAAADVSPRALETAFANEMRTLGNAVLDPFAAALRQIRKDFEARFPGERLTFYFGGDDVTVLLRRDLVYGPDDRPIPAVVEQVLTRVPAGMQIRVVQTSDAPYRLRRNPLRLAMGIADSDQLTPAVKAAEATWTINGVQPTAVVASTNRYGQHVLQPFMAEREAGRKLGRPQMVNPAYKGTVSLGVRVLMKLYLLVFRSASAEDARGWAEVKAEDSILLNGALVAAVELVLLPGLGFVFYNELGIFHAIFLTPVFLVLFHETPYVIEWALIRLYRAFGSYYRDTDPDSRSLETVAVRVAIRYLATAAILGLAFQPLIPLISAGASIPFGGKLFFTSMGIAWMAHTMWNSFVRPSWRLNLFDDWGRLLGRLRAEPVANTPTMAQVVQNYTSGQTALIELVSALPLNLNVASLDRPRLFAAASTGVAVQMAARVAADPSSSAAAAAEYRAFSERLRREATNRDEPGLTMSSGEVFSAQVSADAEEASRVGHTLVALHFLKTNNGNDALRQAEAVIDRQGEEKVAFVVDGDPTALQTLLGNRGIVLGWTPETTMTTLQGTLAGRYAQQQGIDGDAAVQTLAKATYRIILPEGFELPNSFMDIRGPALERYRVFMLVANALLAVELNPMRLEDAADIARLVAGQA